MTLLHVSQMRIFHQHLHKNTIKLVAGKNRRIDVHQVQFLSDDLEISISVGTAFRCIEKHTRPLHFGDLVAVKTNLVLQLWTDLQGDLTRKGFVA